MDNLDSKILALLAKNGRMNASEIAEKVCLSVSACIERIRKLELSGVITGYTVTVNNTKLGKDVLALMNVATEHPKYNDGFVEAVRKNPFVIECYYIAGDFDYFVKILTDNIVKLEETLNYIKGIKGVSKTKTDIVLNATVSQPSVYIDENA
ncbi:MAG: Lrp/AsnC family transcriptional regulator [Clostridia bacterium]|nr:Lrp/AsnC family transcriptional regulator [Clostridia bacterium]